jgi:polyisoprenoid-binding protein YceI
MRAESGVLEIAIQADSVNTGSGLKNDKLKGKDFFDVKDSPTITFKIHESRSDRSQHIRSGRGLYDSRGHENRKTHSYR